MTDKGVIKNIYHITTMNECELDETNTSSVKFFSESLNTLLYIYLYFKKQNNNLLKYAHYRKITPLPYVQYVY
jgi:hypothetical protein